MIKLVTTALSIAAFTAAFAFVSKKLEENKLKTEIPFPDDFHVTEEDFEDA